MFVQDGEIKVYPGVDLVKFIAALLVVAIHISPVASYGKEIDFFLRNYFARIAVPYFFVASGFFLFGKISFSAFDKQVVFSYIKRIFRMYVIWTAIYTPWILKNKIFASKQGIFAATADFIREFIFVGFWQFWYLNALIVATLIIAVCLQFKVSLKNIIVLAGMLYVVGLIPETYTLFLDPIRNVEPIWHILKIIQTVITTTRNGVFDGFLFVSIGMIIAHGTVKISFRKASVGFLFSMALLLIEAIVLEYHHWAKDYNMYLFLVPSAVFLFYMSITIPIKSRPLYKNLRELSVLVFCLHTFINPFVSTGLEIFFKVNNSLVRYTGTVCLTLIVSGCIICLSKGERFKWLKSLYR